jgi:hypothetical protein
MAEGSFTFLTKEEFERLSQADKIAYIDRAVQALQIPAHSPDIFRDEETPPEPRTEK